MTIRQTYRADAYEKPNLFQRFLLWLGISGFWFLKTNYVNTLEFSITDYPEYPFYFSNLYYGRFPKRGVLIDSQSSFHLMNMKMNLMIDSVSERKTFFFGYIRKCDRSLLLVLKNCRILFDEIYDNHDH